jgi:hypothetical protein
LKWRQKGFYPVLNNNNPGQSVLQGMPYGLPGLSQQEHQTLLNWLRDGAPGTPRPAPSGADLQEVQQWEDFFNGTSRKQQL